MGGRARCCRLDRTVRRSSDPRPGAPEGTPGGSRPDTRRARPLTVVPGWCWVLVGASVSDARVATVGGYRLVGVLGSGSSGTVFLGEDGSRRVAVKVLAGWLSSD